MEVLKDKIKNVCFWDKIHSGDLVPASKRRQTYVDTNRKYTPAARSWSPKGNYEFYWGNGKKSEFPFFRAIAMINWKGGGQHTAFVIGETKQGRIAILGGN